MDKNCTERNIKLDVVNYSIHRTVCKTCYNRNRRKKHFTSYPKNETVDNNNNNDRTSIIIRRNTRTLRSPED